MCYSVSIVLIVFLFRNNITFVLQSFRPKGGRLFFLLPLQNAAGESSLFAVKVAVFVKYSVKNQ